MPGKLLQSFQLPACFKNSNYHQIFLKTMIAFPGNQRKSRAQDYS